MNRIYLLLISEHFFSYVFWHAGAHANHHPGINCRLFHLSGDIDCGYTDHGHFQVSHLLDTLISVISLAVIGEEKERLVERYVHQDKSAYNKFYKAKGGSCSELYLRVSLLKIEDILLMPLFLWPVNTLKYDVVSITCGHHSFPSTHEPWTQFCSWGEWNHTDTPARETSTLSISLLPRPSHFLLC